MKLDLSHIKDTDNTNRKHSKFKDNSKGKLFVFRMMDKMSVFSSQPKSVFSFHFLKTQKKGAGGDGETAVLLTASPSFSMLFQDPDPVSSQDEEFENTLKSNRMISVVHNFKI